MEKWISALSSDPNSYLRVKTDLFRNAGIQMTSRTLSPGSHQRMCSSKMRRKRKRNPPAIDGSGGRTQAWKTSGRDWSKAPEMCLQWGKNETNVFRYTGVTAGHKTEVLEHVE